MVSFRRIGMGAAALVAALAACDRARPLPASSGGGLHGNAWIDATSPAFHANEAVLGLAACTACHGATLDGGGPAPACGTCHDLNLPAGVASWKTNCVMCHGGVADSTGAPPRATWGHASDPVRVGAHTSHVRGGLGPPLDCTACHVKPADAFSPGHVDGGVRVTGYTGGDAALLAAWTDPGWDAASATCSTAYCHGATLAGGSVPRPEWSRVDGTQAACGACHGVPPPTGAHLSHVDGGVGPPLPCLACHVTPGATPSPEHVDGKVRVTAYQGSDPAMIAAAGDPGWDRAAATCSTAYCHGATLAGGTLTKPTWTTLDGTQAACGTCHGLPPAALPSAAHPVYLFSAPCTGCHPATAAWDGTSGRNVIVQGGGRHVNAEIEFTFAGHPAGWVGSYPTPAVGGAHSNAAPMGCSTAGCGITMGEYYQCTSCHGKDGDFEPTGGTSRVSCGACHPAFFDGAGKTSCWGFCH